MSPDPRRSATMRAVKRENTGPERRVRRLLTQLGYRYRLHAADLPGRPDIAVRRRRRAIFVHGCFWHGHACPRGARAPKTNAAYWARKIERNRARDAAALAALAAMGYEALVVWECEIGSEALGSRLSAFLGPLPSEPRS